MLIILPNQVSKSWLTNWTPRAPEFDCLKSATQSLCMLEQPKAKMQRIMQGTKVILWPSHENMHNMLKNGPQVSLMVGSTWKNCLSVGTAFQFHEDDFGAMQIEIYGKLARAPISKLVVLMQVSNFVNYNLTWIATD